MSDSSAPQTILVVFGTRPEAIKLFPVVHALADDPRFRVVTCVSAQHRGMLDQVLEIAGIVPDHDLDLMRPDQTLDGLTAALLAENIAPAGVHVTGNTVIDALEWVTARIEAEPALASGLADIEARFVGKRIIGVTSHRRENFGGGLENIAEAIRRIAARPDVALVFPVHPNPNVRRVMDAALAGLPNVAMIEPLDYPHFARLLGLCEIMLTDSGGVQEEAPALGKPVLVMRETTERPEGVTAGTAKLVGTDVDTIVTEIFTLLDDKAAYSAMARAHNPFGDGQSARRIVELLGNVANG
jgi:UDP-N-acetylglucosamine 2-epimerase (non-hydrolysing)